MKDRNICCHCDAYVPVEHVNCPVCRQPLMLDTRGRTSIWQLGKIRDGVTGPLAAGLRNAVKADVIIQPGCLDPRPSERAEWKGISATVFLNQVHRRHKRGGFVSIGLTEENIVPDAMHNFLFGYAYLGFPAAVVSLHPLLDDDPAPEVPTHSLLSDAVHEIGHPMELDQPSYEGGIGCMMGGGGDEEVESLDTIDEGSVLFCKACRRTIAQQTERKNRVTGARHELGSRLV